MVAGQASSQIGDAPGPWEITDDGDDAGSQTRRCEERSCCRGRRMKSPEEYRLKAENALDFAVRTTDPEVRDWWRTIAQHYDHLAALSKRNPAYRRQSLVRAGPEEALSDFGAVDEFLGADCGGGLEEALCDGCLTGRLNRALADVAAIAATLVGSERERDGGFRGIYEGTLTVRGVAYRFRCQVFVDRGGARFLSDVSEFRAIESQPRLAMPE
jgi:hypothetical protein